MNELIDKLLAREDDLSKEAAEALKELADIKLVGGMVKAPDGSWWRPERVVQIPGQAPGVDGWVRMKTEDDKPRIITDV
mgnify:CR=1 FL=1|tara:strand:- start:48026 stop:48262 length:237 start_codon:yes stop_codon:yes gene_type:complete